MRNVSKSCPVRRSRLQVEQLENRYAPATLVNPTTVTFQDVDGDNVTVKISKPLFTDPTTANKVLKFATGSVNGSNTAKQQLTDVFLFLLGPAAQGISLSITAKRDVTDGGNGINGGDSHVNVGQIDAFGLFQLDLGAVIVSGDLGRIQAGDTTTATTGLASLTVQSLGRFGTSTGSPDLQSDINGRLGSLRVKSDIVGAFVSVKGADDGKIGTIFLGGSLIGGASPNSGLIQTSGALGAVWINGDVVGGTGNNSGQIKVGSNGSDAKITGGLIHGVFVGVTVGGAVFGGDGSGSGAIRSAGAMAAVKITGDVVGGAGDSSGVIANLSGKMASVKLGGSLFGGAGSFSGYIGSNGDIGPVKIAGDIVGGSGALDSGQISANGKLASVTLGGSLFGGAGIYNGLIDSSGDMGPVWIKGDVVGGNGQHSGRIQCSGKIASVTLGGSLMGGWGNDSGSIQVDAALGGATVHGDVKGGNGIASGAIFTGGRMTRLLVGGSLLGGLGNYSGEIEAGVGGEMGLVTVHGDIKGGVGLVSGLISSHGNLGGVTVGGSLIGGPSNDTGGILAEGSLGRVHINGDIVGGSVAVGTLRDSGYIEGAHITRVFVGGSIISGSEGFAGTLIQSASIASRNELGPVTVRGNMLGNSSHPVVILAREQLVSLTVGGRVEFTDILAGFDVDLNGVNGDAQIGSIMVGKDWLASSVAAGVVNGGNGFGDGNDALTAGGTPGISARIASILIKGKASGTPAGTDHYGFVAEQIGSLAVGGAAIHLTAGKSNDNVAIGSTGDLVLVEV